MKQTLFLSWALVNSLFLVALASAASLYHGHVIVQARVSIAAVLVVFAIGSGAAGLIAYRQRGRGSARLLELALEIVLPVGMLGTVSGLLMTLSHSADSIEARLPGAATAFASTFTAISCWIALTVLRSLVAKRCRCGA